MTPADGLGTRPWPVGPRALVFLSLLAAGAWGFVYLELDVSGLLPGAGGVATTKRFFARALSPALVSEARFVPAESPPLLIGALQAAFQTVRFAAAAVALSLVIGIGLGIPASTALWAGDPAGALGTPSRWARQSLLRVVYVATRGLIAFLRSIHELLWAVLLLVAFGLNDLTAVIAIALPYGGVLAKIFSEMIDEIPRDAAEALRAVGASPLQIGLFGLLPRALPDMTGYAFYRMECALRASAVLGFFGFPTLGLFIRQSFDATNYGEVWTYLYTLAALVISFDVWSAAVRRRLRS
jgi:phosphonate transport system permease protein